MWRINAVRYYQLLLALLISVEVSVIIIFAVMMITFNTHLILADRLVNFLRLAVFISLIMIANLISYIIIFQLVSNRGDRLYQKNYHKWMKIWAKSYFTDTLPDKIPVTPAVVDAHFDFAKSIPDNEKLRIWANEYNILDYWHKQVNGNNRIQVLRALEATGILGDEKDIDILFQFMDSDRLDVRIASVMAIAHLIARTPRITRKIQDVGNRFTSSRAFIRGFNTAFLNEEQQVDAIYVLADVLIHQPLPVFVIEEIYTILGDQNQKIKSYILPGKQLPDNLLLASIHSIASNYEANFVNIVAKYIHHPRPIIKQAVLKLFLTLNHIPDSVFRDVLLSIKDDDRGVREQALKTFASIPLFRTRLPLWLALGDDDWRVRYAAAETLLNYGAEGQQVLTTASIKHDVSSGKEIARQVLESNL